MLKPIVQIIPKMRFETKLMILKTHAQEGIIYNAVG
jgi:hypothetical protein